MGTLYVNGWGVDHNYGRGLYWLQRAAKGGNPSAQTNLGILYLSGSGVRPDYGEALRYFLDGAKNGETIAMTDLGYMYDQGLEVARDLSEAADWYRMAAERGNAVGQYNLADLYLREGVPPNNSIAFGVLLSAAKQGHSGARIKLGYLYLNGKGTQRDLETAYVWIKAAALSGDQRGTGYLDYLEAKLSPQQLQRLRSRA